MTTASLLLLAMLLDALAGEPQWLWSRLPHPAIVMGRIIGWMDRNWNKGRHRKFAGLAALTLLVVGGWSIGALVAALPGGPILQVLIAAILLAQRSLVQHVQSVAKALRLSVPEGRRAVARIVGRDTAALDEAGVARSAIESAAENLSDGVIAPAFWFLLLGLPGLMVYKVTNTADSMIGYKTERHGDFGWASARFDDLLNWIPARLTALFVILLTGRFSDLRAIARDARRHRSPNAGWPEAAFARALDVALSGPRSYEGQMRDFAFVNPDGAHQIGANDIDRAVLFLWRVWAMFGALLFFPIIFG